VSVGGEWWIKAPDSLSGAMSAIGLVACQRRGRCGIGPQPFRERRFAGCDLRLEDDPVGVASATVARKASICGDKATGRRLSNFCHASADVLSKTHAKRPDKKELTRAAAALQGHRIGCTPSGAAPRGFPSGSGPEGRTK
jgi:hypothetical protein